MKAERPVYWAAEACCLGNRRAPAELLRRALERLPSLPSARGPVWFASILESMGDKEAAWRGHPEGRPDGTAARAAVRARFEGAELIRVNSACTSGAAALALAWLSIRQGAHEDAAVVGYEERSAFIEAGFQSLLTRSAGRPRPFARRRDGFRPAAGAAAVWLSARPSDTDVRLAGAAITNDAHHPTGPHPEGDGLRRAIEQCLKVAGAGPESIDALKLSGSGTPYSDEAEYKALRAAFGSRLASLPAFVPKARIGHLQGAAGVVETALAVHALRSGRIPSVSTELVRDLQFELNLSAQPRSLALRSVLAVYSGFGGQNVCLSAHEGRGRMKGWVAGGYYHPLRIGPGRYDPLRPSEGPVRAARRPPSESVIHSPRLRYVPEPTLMLLHALEEVTRKAAYFLATLSPERVGLFVDPGESWFALQQEFFSPVAAEGPPGASPMLFPHTSEASAASLAAINAGLRGPCLVLQASPETLLSLARQHLRAGLLDGVLIAAIHYGVPARAGNPPPVDCAAAALFDRALGEGSLEATGMHVPAASLGDTGPCAWLFAEEVGHG